MTDADIERLRAINERWRQLTDAGYRIELADGQLDLVHRGYWTPMPTGEESERPLGAPRRGFELVARSLGTTLLWKEGDGDYRGWRSVLRFYDVVPGGPLPPDRVSAKLLRYAT